MKNKFGTILEMFLLVGSVFAFAYIIKDISSESVEIKIEKKIGWLSVLELIVKTLISDKGLVSALDSTDLQNGVSTCPVGNDNSVCQEYPQSECDSHCKTKCVPATRQSTPGCEVGTCFDPAVGTCQERATKENCEERGGQWFNDESGNIAQCQKACCMVGEQVKPLVTATECINIGQRTGISTTFRLDAKNELVCLALGQTKIEGACVFGSEDTKSCKFITKGDCLDNGGAFFPGTLCTNPDLGMGYEKESSAKCVDDKLYWFDSQGNKENIYDANKDKSWNKGYVLTADDSCSVGTSVDSLRNQKTCGNCNQLAGSVCGQKTTGESLSDKSIDFVCKDIRCVDNNGDTRENGESWCEYQGDIGVEKGSKGLSRSVDTPGSRHFRASCIGGEVQINPCADYRNSVCVEEQTERDGNDISSSACVTNLWQLCLGYNNKIEGKGKELEDSMKKRDQTCIDNPTCVLKEVNAADSFKFKLCAPKYPPGFDLQKNAEGGQLSCAFANQKCTVIKVKEIGGWKVKVNKGCLENGFAEQMNDLCMSLGDCGASVNYMGDLTQNYEVKNSPKLSASYLSQISRYSDTVPGKYAKIDNVTQYLNAVGGLEKLGKMNPECNLPIGCDLLPGTDSLALAGGISGALGFLIVASPGLVAELGVPVLAEAATAGETAAALESLGLETGAVLGALGGALAGAAIGFAVTSLLIQFTGIGGGLDPAVTWSLIGAGTTAGLIIGYTVYAAGGLKAAGAACLAGGIGCIIGVVILVIVLLVIVIFKAIGIGDTKKVNVQFICKPWQPVTGGEKCAECGTDGYPCSRYACQSLGVNCRLLNEGTGQEVCTNIGAGDLSAPRISPMLESLSKGFKYDSVSDKGMKIVSGENDGCLKANSPVAFGIKLDEASYCRYNVKHTDNFDLMTDENGGDFGFSNIFLYNHTHFFEVPDLTSLGIESYDPSKRMDFNLYVRCIDGNGNGKDSSEFAINICVKPGEDRAPPVVTQRVPASENVKFDAKELHGEVFTSEPATCKWSLDSGKKYDDMENNMGCANDLSDRASLFGWSCNTTFPINQDENKFYIKCKDQPWYGVDWGGESSDKIKANESKRNEMPSAYEFIIKKTKTPLEIVSVKPNNETFLLGVQPGTVTLEIETSGGVDGRATCYLFGREMGETFGSTHRQIFNQIYQGAYEFPILCKDSAGNTAEASSSFNVKLDVDSPVVTRVYNQDGSLVVITDETSTCAFVKGEGKKDRCNFLFENGTLMTGDGNFHSAQFDGGTYLIKCKDKWDHVPDTCNLVVSGDQREAL